jgi:hypothetical protein
VNITKNKILAKWITNFIKTAAGAVCELAKTPPSNMSALNWSNIELNIMKNTDTNKKEEFLLQVEYQLKINA